MNNPSISELRKLLETYVAEEPARLNHEGWWRTPLLVSAPIDQRFDVLTEIHLVQLIYCGSTKLDRCMAKMDYL